MLENTNIKQFYPGPILNKILDITDFLFKDPEQIHITYSYKNEDGSLSNRELTYGTEYEVAKILPSDVAQVDAALTASTGRVTLKADIDVALGERLTIYRESEIIQEAQYPRTGPFPAASHEGALDYLTMQNQEQQDQIDRSLKVPISTANFDGALPIPVPARALKINNSGSGFEFSEYDPDTALETTKEYMEGAQTAASNALASQNAAASSASSAANSETVATQQANIATVKTQEVTETYNNAIVDIQKNWQDAISDVSTAGAEQVSNIKKTGFYMQDDKLYYINADGETKEFISGGGRELLEIYIDPFCDESENKGRIANGQIIIQSQFKDVTKKLKKRVGWDSENKKATLNTSLVCTEEEWQAIKTASKLGQCGKFVIDDKAGTIRLPAIININGLTDLSKAGLIKDESLPNIKGSFRPNGGNGLSVADTSGAFAPKEETSAVVAINGSTGTGNAGASFDASRSSSTYQDNAPVQQETVQYPYVICVNTGVEEAERPINNYQVNNTNSYGDSKYVGDMTLDNLSWLKSESQTNSGTIYPGFYNWAVANIGQPFGAGYITGPKMYGYSKGTDYHYATINEVPKVGDPVYGAVSGRFVGSIESVDITNGTILFHNLLQQNESVTASRDTKYDVTTTNPYFLIVDQANQTFILPTLNGSEDLLSDKFDNLTLGASGEKYAAPANGWFVVNKRATGPQQYINIAKIDSVPMIGSFTAYASGVECWSIQSVLKGAVVKVYYTCAGTLEWFRFIYAKGNGNLYYYVGDTLQNADLINIARMQEQKADKSEIDGKFQPITKVIFKGAGLTKLTTFDISDIIPTDGIYEIYVSASFSTTSSNNSNLLGATDYNLQQVYIAGTNNGFTTGGNVILQTNNKKIKFINGLYTGGVTNQVISIYGFRRIK